MGDTESYSQKNRNCTSILGNPNFEPNILEMVPLCKHCNEKRFQHEKKGICCSDKEISLVANDVPEELFDLLMSHSEEAIEFRKYIRSYNNNFVFSSFGVRYDKDLYKRNRR